MWFYNKTRDKVNSKELLHDALTISNVCLENNLEFVIGGGISIDAIPFLRRLTKLIFLDLRQENVFLMPQNFRMVKFLLH